MSKDIDKLVKAGKAVTVESALGDLPTTPPSAPAQPASDGTPIPFDVGNPVVMAANALVRALEAPAAADPLLAALAKLREPAPPHYISSLPKQTKKQKEELDKNRELGIRCALCGGWHHKNATHVPYVGHAAVTDRLLSVDPYWDWEPVAWTPEGLPRLDAGGGMWIRLTVGGVTRLGYGHGAQKTGQDPGAREKEVIGDAIRNAAMRFGVALELWHKGELHVDEDAVDSTAESDDPANQPDPTAGAPQGTFISDEQRDRILKMAAAANVEARTICDRFGIDALPQLHADSFDAVMGSLKMTVEKMNKPALAEGNDILAPSTTF